MKKLSRFGRIKYVHSSQTLSRTTLGLQLLLAQKQIVFLNFTVPRNVMSSIHLVHLHAQRHNIHHFRRNLSSK